MGRAAEVYSLSECAASGCSGTLDSDGITRITANVSSTLDHGKSIRIREVMNRTRAKFTALVHVLVGHLALLGCDRSADGGDSEEDAVAACDAAESQSACEAISARGYQCAWVKTVTVTAEAQCESSEELRCVPYAKGAFTPGCSPSPGCHASDPDQPGVLVKPAYREDASGSMLLVNECGGDALGFTACDSGAADADVPACACVCESAP